MLTYARPRRDGALAAGDGHLPTSSLCFRAARAWDDHVVKTDIARQ